MAQFSNYAESGILNWLLRSNTNNFNRPATIAVALVNNVVQETQTGATIPELPNANGYARANLGAPANSTWSEVTQVANSGFVENSNNITFTATGDWGYVSGVAILDSGVYGAGNVLMYGGLATPRVVLNGDTVTLSAGNLDIYVG